MMKKNPLLGKYISRSQKYCQKCLFLKETPHTIAWSIQARGNGYNTSNKQCRLCLLEKWHILFKPECATLNKRWEVFSNCLVLDPSAIDDPD